MEAKKESEKKRKANPALLQKLTVTPELDTVIGRTIAAREESVKYFWEYVKKNNLQNGCEIKVDEKIETVAKKAGVKIDSGKITMFDVGKIVSKNLLTMASK